MFNKRVLFASIAVFVALFATTATLAKIHWLPDYLGDNLDKNNSSRSRDVDEKGKPSMWTPGGYDKEKDATSSEDDELVSEGICPNGWFTKDEFEAKDRICIAKGSYPGIGICYGDCKCDKEVYQYSGDDECNDRYICSKACVEDSTRYYREREDKCDTYYADNPLISSCLGGMCDASGALGADCPIKCAANCCEYRDCEAEGFTPEECPVGSICDFCEKGCGDDTVYSTVKDCDTDYEKDSTGECVLSGCRSGYATSDDSCPYDPKVQTYTLSDTDTGGISGGKTCKKCIVSECNTGWQTPDTNCDTPTPCPAAMLRTSECSDLPDNAKGSTLATCPSPGDALYSFSGGKQCCLYVIECKTNFKLEGVDTDPCHALCVPADCPEGSATTAEDCSPAISNGSYTLGSSNDSYSGDDACYSCQLNCNPGWEGTDCSEETSCPPNSTTDTECIDIDGGKKCPTKLTSNKSGNELCKEYVVSCNAGYTPSSDGNSCVKDCSDYTLSSCPTGGTCTKCDTKYRLTSCNDGYIQSSNTCTENPCTGYNLSSCPVNGQCSECLSGASKKIKLDGCASNYTPSIDGSSCTPTIQSGGNGGGLTSEYDNACNYAPDICPANSICTSITCSTGTKQKVTDCKNNYTLNNNACICTKRETHYADGSSSCDDTGSFDCSGYILDECPPHGSCTVAGCEHSYKLLSCDFGWLKNDEGDECVCDWGSYTRDECPSYAECNNKTCDGTTQYLITKCTESGYKVENNECVCDWPDDYTITDDEYNADSAYYASFACGDEVRFKVSMCKTGYEQAEGSDICDCTETTLTNYPLTQCPDNATCTSKQCSSETRYKIFTCKNGTSKSDDGLSCV